MKNKLIIFLIIVLYISIYFLYDKDPYSQDVINSNLGILQKGYILGSDYLGRDLLTRLMQGFLNSIIILTCVLSITLIFSSLIGILIGYYSGILDKIFMSIIQIFLSIPNILITLFILIFYNNSIFIIIISLSISRILRMSIFIRNETRKLMNEKYIIISQSMGANFFHISKYHLYKNLKNIIITKLSLMIPSIVFTEAFLSFLGIGIKIPKASLGNLIYEGFKNIFNNPTQFILSSLLLVSLSLTFERILKNDKN